MKIRYLGFLLIIIGFVSPFILGAIFPKYLSVSILSDFCFWAAFLLILRPLYYNQKANPYLKWATYAIWINIIITLLLLAYFYLILYLGNFQGIWVQIMFVFGYIANPVQSVFDKLVPPPSVQQPDGSVIGTYSFLRSSLTQFFNLIFYSIFGILAKVIKDRKITSTLSRRQENRGFSKTSK